MANYLTIVPFILLYEGGLSKAKTDNAHKNPVPDGSGYHTNKGVTWGAYVDFCNKNKVPANISLFYDMPKELWLKIWKEGYWNAIGGDKIKSQAIADLMADFAWASGSGTAVKQLQKVLNAAFKLSLVVDGIIGPKTLAAVNGNNEKKVFDSLAWQRETFIKALNQPANERGWMNRLNDLVALKKKILPLEASESSALA